MRRIGDQRRRMILGGARGGARRLVTGVMALALLSSTGLLAPATVLAQGEDIANAPGIVGAAPSALWAYDEASGPARWSGLSAAFAACGVGAEQSPIDIVTESAPEAKLPPVEIRWDRFVPEMVDTGRTIAVKANGSGGGVRLNGVDYRLEHFEFHHRSEHWINGKAADMEVQFVHRSKAGDYLIVAALIRPGTANPLLDTLWPLMPERLGATRGDVPIDPRELLPLPASDYRYAGSLTKPPCSQTVTWSVRTEPVTASEAQIATFAAFYKNNARPVQPLGRRFVLQRK